MWIPEGRNTSVNGCEALGGIHKINSQKGSWALITEDMSPLILPWLLVHTFCPLEVCEYLNDLIIKDKFDEMSGIYVKMETVPTAHSLKFP